MTSTLPNATPSHERASESRDGNDGRDNDDGRDSDLTDRSSPRRYVFFVNTPAHVHLYKHAARRLADRGHDVLVLARDYGCTVPLIEDTQLPYRVYGECDTTKGSLFRELPRHYVRLTRATRRFDPDLIFGIGCYAAHAGALARTPVVLVHDSEPSSLDHAVSRPFARAILTPFTFRKHLGADHYQFRGFKETAYLHPDVFTPRDDVRDCIGVGPDEEFAVVRFNAFGSHHDVNHDGFSTGQRERLVERLAEDLTVFVSDEAGDAVLDVPGVTPFDVHPARLHDALAEASLLVADTQTMVTEAALLGTPAIRSNSFVGGDDMGNFLELERAGLIDNLAEFDAVVSRIDELLADDVADQWAGRRDEYVADLVNLTDVIVDVATTEDAVGAVPELAPVDA